MNAKKKPIAYGDAITELDEILAEIEASDVDLDRLAGRVERASTLVKTLKTRIRETELKVTRVVQDLREEVAREDEPARAPAAAADEAADGPLVDRDGAPLIEEDEADGALFEESDGDDVPF